MKLPPYKKKRHKPPMRKCKECGGKYFSDRRIEHYCPECDQSGIWKGATDTSWYNSKKKTFTINTAEELAGLAQLVNDGNSMKGKIFKLGCDIVLNKTNKWNNEWTPIYGFAGTFDGLGKTVSGIYINSNDDFGNYDNGLEDEDLPPWLNKQLEEEARDESGQGLFAYVSYGSVIKNLGILDSFIKGKYSRAGALAGIACGNNTIINCYASNVKVEGYNGVGALVGCITQFIDDPETSLIKDCYASECDVCGNKNVGGLVGWLVHGNIENCYTRDGVVKGKKNIGGLVGNFEVDFSSTDEEVKIVNCYSLNNTLHCESKVIGGLVGIIFCGSVVNCYAANHVNVNGKNHFASLVGSSEEATIKDNYAENALQFYNELQNKIDSLKDYISRIEVQCEGGKKFWAKPPQNLHPLGFVSATVGIQDLIRLLIPRCMEIELFASKAHYILPAEIRESCSVAQRNRKRITDRYGDIAKKDVDKIEWQDYVFVSIGELD